MKAVGIAIQTAMLVQLMERGLPSHLMWLFMSCLISSSGSCAMIIHSTRKRRVLWIALADTLYVPTQFPSL